MFVIRIRAVRCCDCGNETQVALCTECCQQLICHDCCTKLLSGQPAKARLNLQPPNAAQAVLCSTACVRQLLHEVKFLPQQCCFSLSNAENSS